MMEKIQRFGSAMLAPVLLFAFAGLAVGIGTVATLPNIVGDLANEDTFWYQRGLFGLTAHGPFSGK